jgi:hypothetical protein
VAPFLFFFGAGPAVLSMVLSALESFAICAHRIPLTGQRTLLVEGQHILVGLAATRAWAVEVPFEMSGGE